MELTIRRAEPSDFEAFAHHLSDPLVFPTVSGKGQGQGVGRRLMQELLDLADNWLNVIRIELTVFTENARAIALYEQLGFEIEGTHRAYALRDGRYADTYSMARVRPKAGAV